MIESIKEIQSLFREIDSFPQKIPETDKLEIYVIGGTVLLEQGLKPATKDIDLVVLKAKDFTLFENTLKMLAFKNTKPTPEYFRFNISQVLERKDFGIDLFQTTVCGKFSITSSMAKISSKLRKNIKHLRFNGKKTSKPLIQL